MIISDLLKNPITYWLRWVINKNKFLYKNNKNNVKIDYLSHITNSKIDSNSTLYQNVRLHNVNMGSFSYIANNTVIIGAEIGKFCSVGPFCRIGLGMHPSSDFVSTHPIFFSPESHVGVQFTKENFFTEFETIKIGNDVWIGANVLIKDGITIGNGAIIAAGAVVTKNVAAYAIVGGCPAKIIRMRFNDEEIDYLSRNPWWDNNIHDLQKNYLQYHNINSYIEGE